MQQSTVHFDWNAWYPTGQNIAYDIPYSNFGNGTLTITRISADTAGFTLVSLSPSQPQVCPIGGNVTLHIVFNVPSARYVGPFNFTVYYDWHP